MTTPPRTRQVASLTEVAAFVADGHAERFPDTLTPWEQLPSASPADVLAEAKAEGRLVTPRRVNFHE